MGEVVRHPAAPAWSDDELFEIVQGRAETSPSGPDRRHALELLFDRFHARVHSQCARLLGDRELADDATQEIFLSLLERPVRYEGRQHFGSWLYVVVRNYCLNLRRRRHREVQAEDVSEIWSEALVDPGNPGRDLQERQLAGLMERACHEHLTVREREVVHLRYFWGMRVKEIGETLGLENVSGARTHLATAHRKLRDALRSEVGERELRLLFGEA